MGRRLDLVNKCLELGGGKHSGLDGFEVGVQEVGEFASVQISHNGTIVYRADHWPKSQQEEGLLDVFKYIPGGWEQEFLGYEKSTTSESN